MPRKTSKQNATSKIKVKKESKITNKQISEDLSYAKEDKFLKKVEKYVDKNREKTSQEMAERKSKRPVRKYQEWELELMISRVSADSKPKERTKEVGKRMLYIIYAIIFVVSLIFIIKHFFVWKVPQIS